MIADAIRDENVLKFAVEYVGRYRYKDTSRTELDIEVEGIDTKELMSRPTGWKISPTTYWPTTPAKPTAKTTRPCSA